MLVSEEREISSLPCFCDPVLLLVLLFNLVLYAGDSSCCYLNVEFDVGLTCRVLLLYLALSRP